MCIFSGKGPHIKTLPAHGQSRLFLSLLISLFRALSLSRAAAILLIECSTVV